MMLIRAMRDYAAAASCQRAMTAPLMPRVCRDNMLPVIHLPILLPRYAPCHATLLQDTLSLRCGVSDITMIRRQAIIC